MKKVLIAIAILVCSLHVFAQNTKGLSVVDNSHVSLSNGKTYALIVGISKYKNPSIPPLQYADKDAYAFSEYLRNCGVDSNNIILLLNEKATNGDFWANIVYLIDLAKPGDKVYVYFSGHGDVENKSIAKDAYLLPYDAPKCAYVAGAIPVFQLKGFLETWSANNIQVVFIADACRSGNLAGGREGMEAAASVLKEKWKDEVKILSCQPGELSLEGKQWGGGRGLFSYYLINGLYGLADNDKDGKVTLRELNLYLMQKVAEDAKPQDQDPMLYGNMNTVLANVDKKQLDKLNQQSTTPLFASVDTKGFEDGLLKGLDDSIVQNYQLFKTYLDSGILLRKLPQPSAYLYFFKVPDNHSTHPLYALMTRNYSAALMREIDQGLSIIYQNRLDILGPSGVRSLSFEGQILRMILGDEILRKQTFLAKAMFWDAMRCVFTNTLTEEEGLKKIDSCLLVEPNASYAYLLKGKLLTSKKKYNEAIPIIEKGINLAPKLTYSYDGLRDCYLELGRYDDAINMYRKLAVYDTICLMASYEGFIATYMRMNKRDSAYIYVNKEKSFFLNNTDSAIVNMGLAAIAGDFFYKGKDFERSIHYYDMATNNHYGNTGSLYYNISCDESLLNNKSTAILYLDKALEHGYPALDKINSDTDLDNIRSTKEFKALIKKHFPDK
ncbi:MAG: caspase family protein [Bacteroidota bacterium]